MYLVQKIITYVDHTSQDHSAFTCNNFFPAIALISCLPSFSKQIGRQGSAPY